MDRWAAALGLGESERARWRTAGWMHDALRDASPEDIRKDIENEDLRALPGSFLHGPAAADRMARAGFADAEVLDAIRFHTLGHPDLGRLGRALIAADALEPGRFRQPSERAALRARFPFSCDDVLRAVIGEKLTRAVHRQHSLRPEMVALWNRLVADARTD
jgi:HD superfamily phosphohydrolase YqeK